MSDTDATHSAEEADRAASPTAPPPPAAEAVSFTDLFDLAETQAIQDAFSAATGVASIITMPDGTPITRPSGFCRLCIDLIRGTELGLANCLHSDAELGHPNPAGPTIRPCLSGGLWDAGASIMAGGQHVANWLIGQVRNEEQDEAAMLAYADEIGVDRKAFAAALAEVPAMPLKRFELIAQMLFLFANELSVVALQNLEQRRLLGESERSHEALRKNRTLLTAILDAVPQSIFLKNAEGAYMGCNRRFAENVGLESTDEIVGKTDYDLCWNPEDAIAYRADDRQVLTSGVAKTHIIEQLRQADGSVIWVDTSKIPLSNGSAPPTAVLGVFDDITERKRTEEALAASAERNRVIVQAALDGFALTDLTGRILEVNDAYCRMIGYSSDELLTMTADDVQAVDSHTDLAQRARRIIEKGFDRFETRHRRRDGAILDVEVSIRHLESSGGRFALFLRDMTEQKRAERELRDAIDKSREAEEALRENYDMLVNLTDMVPGVVYQYRLYPDGRSCFPFSSRGMDDIYEYLPEEVRGDATPVFGRLHPEDYDRVAADIAESAARLSPFHCEFRVVLPRQGLRWRLSDAIPQRLDDGSTLWYGIISDVTDRVLSEQALRESEASLNRAQHQAHFGNWVWDVANDRVDGSDEVYHLFGLDRETFGGSMSDLIATAIHADDRAAVEADVRRALAGGEPMPIEFRVVWSNDLVRMLHGDAAEVSRDADGKALIFRGTLRDITAEKALHDAIERQADRIAKTLTSVIDIASTIVETRDPYTAGHQRRVAEIATRVAERLGFPERTVNDIRLASLLHDVGKIQIPSELLVKPGKLSHLEYELLKGHAEAGFRIVEAAHVEQAIAEMVHQHHERCDGSGYPKGLTADRILPAAKIIAVADVMEAMMSDRPYRPAVGVDAALAEIERGAGTQYDADAARACVALFREGFELV